MTTSAVDQELWQLVLQADAVGIRLELVNGVPLWEPSPVRRHQRTIDAIRNSLQPDAGRGGRRCACVHLADVYVRFPDGSLKRPDISIWCEEPAEDDEAITLIPQATVEVISVGYEYKDTHVAPAFYLANGVLDVVVVDPRTGAVAHHRQTGTQHLRSPATVTLVCGCTLTV